MISGSHLTQPPVMRPNSTLPLETWIRLWKVWPKSNGRAKEDLHNTWRKHFFSSVFEQRHGSASGERWVAANQIDPICLCYKLLYLHPHIFLVHTLGCPAIVLLFSAVYKQWDKWIICTRVMFYSSERWGERRKWPNVSPICWWTSIMPSEHAGNWRLDLIGCSVVC